jgi:uncharacterized protein (TIGR01777 family)
MRITLTGGTGLIGRRVVAALVGRGDEVTVLARDPRRAAETGAARVQQWDALAEPPPVDALSGADAIVHLAGEPVAQRWTDDARRRIRDSRTVGTANLVRGLEAADPRPATLISASASGYYGDRASELLEESAAAGPPEEFLTSVCIEWEQTASKAASLGMRVASVRTGVVLDRAGGALARMLPPFRAFVGGPVAGGRQFMSWIALEDLARLYVAAVDDERWSGAVNGCAPAAVTNAEFSHALGRALHRPAVLPVPALALRVLYGKMSSIVLASQRMVPAKALGLGFEFRHGELDAALAAALQR